MLAIALQFSAGSRHLDLCMQYKVSESYLYEILYAVCMAFQKAYPRAIDFPTTQLLRKQVSEGFAKSSGGILKGCIGCLDGIHIEITKPREGDSRGNSGQYFNRNGCYSILLIASCNHKKQFTFVSDPFAGSTHDSSAFQASDLYFKIKENFFADDEYIICDEGFTLMPHLVIPFGRRKHLDEDLIRCNYWISRIRMNIECSFGILRSRFRLLTKPSQMSFRNLSKVLHFTMGVHNICMEENDSIQDIFKLDYEAKMDFMKYIAENSKIKSNIQEDVRNRKHSVSPQQELFFKMIIDNPILVKSGFNIEQFTNEQ